MTKLTYDRTIEVNRRDLTSWWRIEANLITTSASQIGSHESDVSDQTFSVDDAGRVLLYGTTLAGALRAALLNKIAGYRADETGALNTDSLFGNTTSNQSLLIIFDSVSTEPAKKSVRDGVSICSETGLATDGAKYDREVALPGLTFPVRIDLQVPRDRNEVELLHQLCAALDALSDGSIRFGARRSRGLGAVRTHSFHARRYDLSTISGWTEYAESSYDNNSSIAVAATSDTVGAAMQRAWKQFTVEGASPDTRKMTSILLKLQVHGTLLIRSPGETAASPDVAHLTEAGKSVLSGTALAGALRSRALRILNTLDISEPQRKIDDLFGSVSTASRLRVAEAVVEGGNIYRQSRVKIDRFTQGTIEGALFEEQPSVGGTINTAVQIIEPKDCDIGLIILVIRDLLQGHLPVGGGAAVGRGVLGGTASFEKLPDRNYSLILDAAQPPDSETLVALQAYVDALLRTAEGGK